MICIEPYLFENLNTAKRLWDAGFSDEFLSTCGDTPVDSEEYYEIAWQGINSIFDRFRNYYNEEEEMEIYVFFDSLIDRFYELCAAYEKANGLLPEENSLRNNGERMICESFGFWDYSCGWFLTGNKHGRPRLVVLYNCDFCGLHILPIALASAHRELEEQVAALEAQMKKKPKRRPILRLPKEKVIKEAA